MALHRSRHITSYKRTRGLWAMICFGVSFLALAACGIVNNPVGNDSDEGSLLVRLEVDGEPLEGGGIQLLINGRRDTYSRLQGEGGGEWELFGISEGTHELSVVAEDDGLEGTASFVIVPGQRTEIGLSLE